MQKILEKAYAAHKVGLNESALNHYQQLIQNYWDEIPATVPMNAAALMRQKSDVQSAIKLLQRALIRFPDESGLWNNLGNCYGDVELIAPSINCYRQSLRLKPDFVDCRLSLVPALLEAGCPHLAYAVALKGFTFSDDLREKYRFTQPLISSLLGLSKTSSEYSDALQSLANYLEGDLLKSLNHSDKLEILFSLLQVWTTSNLCDKALETRRRLRDYIRKYVACGFKLNPKFTKFWHQSSWNLSICLLKHARFSEGWSLYEHGLQVPASAPQRWQRSLQKPFSPALLPFWKGEPLLGKRLLLLAEQGIGDGMMFATLIPSLQVEGAKISMLVNDRLLSIYKRSMPSVSIFSSEDFAQKICLPGDFDYQSPIGSICQYRFNKIDSYASHSPVLVADKQLSNNFRCQYSDGRPLIGLSWQGGGKPDRIKAKSIGLVDLTPLLSSKSVRFVSLQYGDDGPHLENFEKATGINIVHDDSVNPLKDMDRWLAQVAAMDGVLSIANTTIHGAGGLGVPTFCLVSAQSDWRWINPSVYQGCYWYPSVEVAYQDENQSWNKAVTAARQWLSRSYQA